MMRWRTLLSPPSPGAENMALDEALMRRARETGEGVVRVYSWSQPTLSLGRHQRALGAYDPERATALGLAIVRRPTGGRVVLHHREITYSVTAPLLPGEGNASGRSALAEAYCAINVALVEALRSLGAKVAIARATSRTPPPGSAPCFELPSDGEITLGAAKLAGSAQYREGGAYLQHGSILVHDDQAMLALVASAPAHVPPAATLAGALGREVSVGEFAGVLFDVVHRRWDAEASALTCEEAGAVARDDLRERYESAGWTWRR